MREKKKKNERKRGKKGKGEGEREREKERRKEEKKRKGKVLTSLDVKYRSLGVLWLNKISVPLWIFQNFIPGVNNLRTGRLSAKYISSKLLIKNRFFFSRAELVWELKFQDCTLLFT